MLIREAYIYGALLETSKEIFEGFIVSLSKVLELSIGASLSIAVAVLVVKLV